MGQGGARHRVRASGRLGFSVMGSVACRDSSIHDRKDHGVWHQILDDVSKELQANGILCSHSLCVLAGPPIPHGPRHHLLGLRRRCGGRHDGLCCGLLPEGCALHPGAAGEQDAEILFFVHNVLIYALSKGYLFVLHSCRKIGIRDEEGHCPVLTSL